MSMDFVHFTNNKSWYKIYAFDYGVIQNLKDQFVPNQTEVSTKFLCVLFYGMFLIKIEGAMVV